MRNLAYLAGALFVLWAANYMITRPGDDLPLDAPAVQSVERLAERAYGKKPSTIFMLRYTSKRGLWGGLVETRLSIEGREGSSLHYFYLGADGRGSYVARRVTNRLVWSLGSVF